MKSMFNSGSRRLFPSLSASIFLASIFTIPFVVLHTTPVYAFTCGTLSSLSSYGQSYSSISYLPSSYAYYSYLARTHGVSLDQAATFVQDMSDITGAYYDQATNRVVLVGTKNTSPTPVFNKDDFAVAVRALVFNNAIPQVSIGDTWTGGPTMQVSYNGQIENTNFGSVLAQADYSLKQYFSGYTPSQQPITSSVPSYRSAANRYIDQTPGSDGPNGSSFRITPKQMTLQKNDATGAFVFSQASMQVVSEPIYASNSAKWNSAVVNWAQDLTNNYDAYAQELPTWQKTKQLGKIVAMVKWLKDNNIATDYTWAKDYTPTSVSTPTSFPTVVSPNITQGIYTYQFSGGVNYNTPNTYTADTGSASTLKNNSQSAAPSAESNNWTFTQNSQLYQAVAVDANAFRSAGAYSTKVTDVSNKIRGNSSLSFSRAYNSQTKNQQTGIGNGWSYASAQLTNPQIWNNSSDSPVGGYSGAYASKLIYQDIDGDYQTFTYSTSLHKYVADRSDYHSVITRGSDGSYTVTAKDQSSRKFDIGLYLIIQRDKNGNPIYYHYDSTPKLTSMNDDYGHTLTINYNAQNLVSSVVDWASRSVIYGYDSLNNLTSVTDPRGNAFHYTYDASNRLATAVDRQGKQLLNNTYNTQDKVISSTNGSLLAVSYTYDESTRKVTATDGSGNVTKTYYDQNGRVTEQDDAYGGATVYTYGSEASPLTVKNKLNNITTYTYDTNGNVTSMTDASSKQVTYTYNTQNLVTQVSDGRYTPNRVTTLTYNTAGNLLSSNEAGITTTSTYDSTGMTSSSSDGLSHALTYTYDSLGNKLTETNALGAVTNYTYDSAGRLTQRTDESGKIFSYGYDANSNVTSVVSAAGTTSNEYSAENRLISITTPDNQTTQYAYNSDGGQTSTTDALTNLTSYGYDQYDNMVSKQDALSRTTQYAYDKLKRQTQSTTPAGKIKKWFYDANGNISKTTDESNRDTTYTYDTLDRLKVTSLPDSTSITYSYDARSNLTQLIDASGTTQYAYDVHDRLTSATDPNNSILTYTYDNANNITQITYPGSKNVNYTYDNANHLLSVKDWNLSSIAYQYNPNGTISSKSMPNGITANYTYDGANRLSQVQYLKNTQPLVKYSYTRNAAGNVSQETTSTPTVPSTYTIYDEGLTSGWNTSWSWGSTVNATDTTNPYAGTKDLSWKVNAAWAGLTIRNGTSTVSTNPYTAVTFALKASQSGQGVAVSIQDSADNNTAAPIYLSAYGGDPTPTGYTQYTIPLVALNANNKNIKSITLEDVSGSVQPKMYLDSVKLTTASPSPIGIYGDSVAQDVQDWSWGVTNNLNDTTLPYSGVAAIGTTINAGYGALALQNSVGYNTKGYNSLSFALKSSLPNQAFSVSLTNASGDPIGTAVNMNSYGTPSPSSYTVYNIPLVDLHGANSVIYGLNIQEQNGTSQPKISIDDIKILPSSSAPTTDVQSNFGYDAIGRVTSANVPGHTYVYTYDSTGNRKSSTTDGTLINSAFNTDNQLTSQGTRNFTYDNQGNQITDGAKTLTYSPLNLLKTQTNGATTINYLYDGNGNRLGKNIGSTPSFQYVNDVSGSNSRVLITKNIAAGTQNYYVYGNDLLSQGGLTATSRQYYMDDGLGNVRYVTDSVGNTVQTFAYDPYGNQITGSNVTDFTYQSEQKDQENGLTFLRARYYDTSTGRFLSKDPVSGTLTNAQSQNGYSYADDNPVNLSDPSGKNAISDFFSNIGNSIGSFFSGGSGSNLCDPSVIIPGISAISSGSGPEVARAEASRIGIKIPANYVAERAENGKGWVFRAPGSQGNVGIIRIAEATSDYPTGYARVYNSYGQPVNILGKPGVNADTHFPLLPQEKLPVRFPFIRW